MVLRLTIPLTLGWMLLIMAAYSIGGTQPRRAMAFVSGRENTNKLYLMDINRGISHKLSDQPVIGCCPTWSPDGEQIAFLSVDESAAKIFVMDWNGGNLRRLTQERFTNEGSPAWSPDGKQIAFLFVSLLTSRSAIFIADVEAGRTRPLTGEYANDLSPVWSPDGESILFASDLGSDGTSRLDDSELFSISLTSGERRQLTNDNLHDSAAAFSPDGKLIAFTTTPPDYFPISIYQMKADGSKRWLITDQDVSRNTAPLWSPDGKQLLFLSHRDGDVELYTVDMESKKLYQLTDNRYLDWMPGWSPDGEHILFLSGRDGDSAVYMMEADGSNPRRLTPYPSNDTFAAWQPTGK